MTVKVAFYTNTASWLRTKLVLPTSLLKTVFNVASPQLCLKPNLWIHSTTLGHFQETTFKIITSSTEILFRSVRMAMSEHLVCSTTGHSVLEFLRTAPYIQVISLLASLLRVTDASLRLYVLFWGKTLDFSSKMECFFPKCP